MVGKTTLLLNGMRIPEPFVLISDKDNDKMFWRHLAFVSTILTQMQRTNAI